MVQKSGPLDSPIAFRVSSDDGLEPPQTVTFEAGVDAPDMITVSYILLDDVIGLELDQVFTVNLDVVTTNPQIVFSIRQATVTITDNDSELCAVLPEKHNVAYDMFCSLNLCSPSDD